jgi:hypothetical protein
MSRVAGSWKVQVSQFRSRYGGRESAVMSSVASPEGLIHLGMDTSKNTIVVATLLPGEDSGSDPYFGLLREFCDGGYPG